MRLNDKLNEWAQYQADKPAIIVPGRPTVSYDHLAVQAESVSKRLREAGVAPGAAISLVLPNGPQMLAAFYGATTVGVAAPYPPDSRDAELVRTFSEQAPAAVVTLRDSVAAKVARRQGIRLIELPGELKRANGVSGSFEHQNGDQPANGIHSPTAPTEENGLGSDGALLMRTSGTTSRPKQFVLTHRNLAAAIRRAADHLQLTSQDRYLNVMPLFHTHGLMRCLWTIGTGGTIICPERFDATAFFDWIDDFQPTWYSAVTTVHQAVLAAAPRHGAAIRRSRLRFAITNSAVMPQAVREKLEAELATPILELYGCSETCSATIEPVPPQPRKPGSVGVPIIDLAIMNDAGELLPAGETGEIVMRGETVTSGYLNDLPRAESDSGEMQRALTPDGWFRSGDLGYLDEDGFLFLRGRLKEIINRGGEKISPVEVDEVLLRHPAVEQAVTFGVPHATLEEEVAAVVVMAEGAEATTDQIREFVAKVLSPRKTPREIVVAQEIPKSRNGKVIRRNLAMTLGLNFNRAGEGQRFVAVSPHTRLEQRLVNIWREVLGLEQIGITDNLFQLGANSLTAMQISTRIADVVGVELAPAVFFEHPTIAELALVIAEQQAAEAESASVPRRAATA